jgi:hypothetical protein
MKVGHPPIYKTNEELQAAIHDYFNNGVAKRTIIVGKPGNQEKVEIPTPTICGLAFYIGFESRQSFYDYEKRPEFSYTIKRARLFIEKEYEEQLLIGNTTGAIFALKNMGWTDRQAIDHTTGGESFKPTFKVLSSEALSQINKLYERPGSADG